jgi:hypothetical protein
LVSRARKFEFAWFNRHNPSGRNGFNQLLIILYTL